MSYLYSIDFSIGDNSVLRNLLRIYDKNPNINFNEIDTITEKNGLHFCSENLNVKSFFWLKDKGVPLYQQDKYGNTPIHHILFEINKDIMDINIEENLKMLKKTLESPLEINFDLKNLRGETILEVAKYTPYTKNIVENAFREKEILINKIKQKDINNKIKENDFELDLNDDFSFL